VFSKTLDIEESSEIGLYDEVRERFSPGLGTGVTPARCQIEGKIAEDQILLKKVVRGAVRGLFPMTIGSYGTLSRPGALPLLHLLSARESSSSVRGLESGSGVLLQPC
jgi:hypothetical protein